MRLVSGKLYICLKTSSTNTNTQHTDKLNNLNYTCPHCGNDFKNKKTYTVHIESPPRYCLNQHTLNNKGMPKLYHGNIETFINKYMKEALKQYHKEKTLMFCNITLIKPIKMRKSMIYFIKRTSKRMRETKQWRLTNKWRLAQDNQCKVYWSRM